MLCGLRLPRCLFFIFSADECFVHFHNAHQLPELRVRQRRAQTVTHIESGAVRACSDNTMYLQRADSLFGGQDHVENFEPNQERVFRVLVDGASDEREAISISASAIRVGTFPMPRLREAVDVIRLLAARAGNAVRPAMLREISAARILIGKENVELSQRHLASELRMMLGIFVALFAHVLTIAQSYLSVKCQILTFANDPYDSRAYERFQDCVIPPSRGFATNAEPVGGVRERPVKS